LFINTNYYMSGSAGLASARRRRAGPNTNVPNTPENSVVDRPNVQPNQNSGAMAPMNPLALLVKHNELIKALTQEVDQLKQKLAEVSTVKPDTNNRDTIDYFKQQYNSLLEEMKETKKTLLKIQTFSMETNIEVMKLKRSPVPNESPVIEEN
jgi:hypothetical protein